MKSSPLPPSLFSLSLSLSPSLSLSLSPSLSLSLSPSFLPSLLPPSFPPSLPPSLPSLHISCSTVTHWTCFFFLTGRGGGFSGCCSVKSSECLPFMCTEWFIAPKYIPMHVKACTYMYVCHIHTYTHTHTHTHTHTSTQHTHIHMHVCIHRCTLYMYTCTYIIIIMHACMIFLRAVFSTSNFS